MVRIKYCPPRGVSRNLGNTSAYEPAIHISVLNMEVSPISEVQISKVPLYANSDRYFPVNSLSQLISFKMSQ